MAYDWYRKARASSGPVRREALANLEYLRGNLDVQAARQAGLRVIEAPGSGVVEGEEPANGTQTPLSEAPNEKDLDGILP